MQIDDKYRVPFMRKYVLSKTYFLLPLQIPTYHSMDDQFAYQNMLLPAQQVHYIINQI
jgi:hypothetical protein